MQTLSQIEMIKLSGKISRRAMRKRLIAKQKHKCVICDTKINIFESHPTKINRALNFSDENTVLLCSFCSGSQSSSVSLKQYYEVDRHIIKPVKVKTEYPESYQQISETIVSKCKEYDMSPVQYLREEFFYCPPEKIEEAILSIMTKIQTDYERKRKKMMNASGIFPLPKMKNAVS